MSEAVDPVKVKAVVDQAFEKWRCASHCDEKSDQYREKFARIKARVDEFFKQAEKERVLLAFAFEALRAVAGARGVDAVYEAQALAERAVKLANPLGKSLLAEAAKDDARACRIIQAGEERRRASRIIRGAANRSACPDCGGVGVCPWQNAGLEERMAMGCLSTEGIPG